MSDTVDTRTTDPLAQRVERLERSMRRHALAHVVLIGLLAGLVVIAAGSPVADEVRARRFVAVNAEGLEVAHLDAEAGPGAVLELGGWKGLEDEENRVRIAMAFNSPSVVLTSGGSTAELSIGFEDPFLRLKRGDSVGALLGVKAEWSGLDLAMPGDASTVSIKAQKDSSGLVMKGPNSEAGVSLITSDSISGVSVDDARGKPRVMLTRVEAGVAGLHLFDSEGDEVVTLTSATDFSGLSLGLHAGGQLTLGVAADVIGLIMRRVADSDEGAQAHVKITDDAGTGVILQDESGKQLLLKPVGQPLQGTSTSAPTQK